MTEDDLTFAPNAPIPVGKHAWLTGLTWGGRYPDVESAVYAYVAGRIEVDELERRVGDLLGVS